jgi:Lar family restriction alleviation protein
MGMNDIELKPCPFCGSKAKIITVGIHGYNEQFVIHCMNCYAETTQYAALSFVIEAWNKRVGEQDDK